MSDSPEGLTPTEAIVTNQAEEKAPQANQTLNPEREEAVHDVNKFKAWVQEFTSRLAKHQPEQTTVTEDPAGQLRSNISRIEDFQKRYTNQTSNADNNPIKRTGTEG